MNDNSLTLEKSETAQNPFSMSPVSSDELFLLTPALQNHSNTLINIAKSGTSIGLVKGDPGSGKSSLAHYLARRLQQEPNIKVWRLNAQPETELIPALTEEAGMSAAALGNEPRKRFIEHLTLLRNTGTTVVLLIDDAHLLTPQALHLVIRLGLSPVSGQTGLMHTLMFAESDIESRLWLSAIDNPLPLDRLYTLVLPTLNAEQTYAYLKHRLTASGYSENAVFSQTEANLIHRKTEGVPGLINELAARRLNRQSGGRKASRRILPAMMPPRRPRLMALSGSVVAIALAGLLWWYVGSTPTLLSSDETIVAAQPSPTQQSASLFAAATQQESVLTLPGQEVATVPAQQEAALNTNGEASQQISQPATTAPESHLQQQNDATVATGNYSIQETGSPLTTPATPDYPPAPKDALRDPQASPKADTTPEVISSPLHQSAAMEIKGDLETPQTPMDRASPKQIEVRSLLPTEDTALVSDTAVIDSDSFSIRGFVKTPQDNLQNYSVKTNVTADTPSMPPLAKPEIEAAVLAANLPPQQPVAVAKPFSDNNRAGSSTYSKLQVPDEASSQVEKTVPDLQDKITETTSGQRIALNSVRRERWLNQRQPNEFAVQIMSGPNEAGLRQFIERNRFPTTPGYYQARNGLYKLVLPYPDETQARQALKTLPETLQRYGQPWIRSMADVQNDML